MKNSTGKRFQNKFSFVIHQALAASFVCRQRQWHIFAVKICCSHVFSPAIGPANRTILFNSAVTEFLIVLGSRA